MTEEAQPDGPTQIESQAALLRKQQGEQLRAARNKAGMTITQLADAAGLHFNTVGRIERGEADANFDQLLRFAKALKIDLGALVPVAKSVTGDLLDDEFALVDVLDVQVSAGNGALNGHAQPITRFAFQRRWLNHLGVRPENARIIKARGDSMADKINDGDVLLVDTAVQRVDRDGVYVIELEGMDYVKMLQRDFATGGVQIISYNPNYKPQLLSAEQAAELRISGRVVWHGGDV